MLALSEGRVGAKSKSQGVKGHTDLELSVKKLYRSFISPFSEKCTCTSHVEHQKTDSVWSGELTRTCKYIDD